MICFLDTGPLGAIANPNATNPKIQKIKLWAKHMVQAGHVLIVPAVVDYEQRREHTRRNATDSLTALDEFIAAEPNRYLALTDSALKRAAVLWANIRNSGLPTADAKALDCDIILAAQVLDVPLSPGSFIVVTDNTNHLSRVVVCDIWQNIIP